MASAWLSPRGVGATVLALLLTAPFVDVHAAASESSKEEARALANRAADAIARGEHIHGEALLAQAYARYPAPTIALLQARTLVLLQRWADAVSVYERASLAPVAPDAPDAFRHAALQARSEVDELRPRVPRLKVSVLSPGSVDPRLRLSLDDRAISSGQRGRWMLVDPGRRVVRAELGDASSERVVHLGEKQALEVVVEQPVPRSTQSRMAWGAIGAGVVGIGAGVSTGMLAANAHARADNACPNERCVEGTPGARDLERFRNYRLVSTIGYALGFVGVGTGGVLLARGTPKESRLQVRLGAESVSLSWAGQL